MKIPQRVQAILDANNMFIHSGGYMGRVYHLTDYRVPNGATVENFVRNHRCPADEFLRNNPGAELTGVYNDLGNELAVLANWSYPSVQVYNARQVERYATNGF